jgi:uncharacterized membrane protein YhaH (DUF805 family)
MKQLVLVGRVIFGAWMAANGANHFLSLWPEPIGQEPLAIQLMAALSHSGLLGVAMTIQLVTGVLVLTGFLVPVALCIVMPVSTCALFWSAILDHQPLGTLVALVAFALNGLLMLAYIEYYRGALQRQALMIGESTIGERSFDFLFVNPSGRTPRGRFTAALMTLLAAAAFYAFLVKGATAHWAMLMLVFPGIVLLARRLHDMGRSAWPVLVPAVLMVVAFANWLHLISLGSPLATAVAVAALAVSAGFAVWCCIGSGQAEANRFGMPAAV